MELEENGDTDLKSIENLILELFLFYTFRVLTSLCSFVTAYPSDGIKQVHTEYLQITHKDLRGVCPSEMYILCLNVITIKTCFKCGYYQM